MGDYLQLETYPKKADWSCSIPSCADSYLLQTVLREHWNWGSDPEKGHLVVSDCDAVGNIYDSHKYTSSYAAAAADALNAGTDLDCGTTYPNYLPTAYNENLFTESTLVTAVTRLFTSLVTTGWFDPPANQPYRQLGWQDVNAASSQTLAYKAAVGGTVLIKNNGILPLSTSNVKKIALIGPWADATTQMQSNYQVCIFLYHHFRILLLKIQHCI
jgi:xylan 1,4-beta-xylosidase